MGRVHKVSITSFTSQMVQLGKMNTHLRTAHFIPAPEEAKGDDVFSGIYLYHQKNPRRFFPL